MAETKELAISPAGRNRGRRALPVDGHGTVYTNVEDRVVNHRNDSLPVRRVDGPRAQRDFPGVEPEEDIVDAEIIEDADEQDAPRNRRERMRDRTRSFFGAATWQRTEERERQRRRDQARADADDEGLDDRERLLKLRAETRLAGEKFMQSLRDSKLLVPGFNEEERAQEFDAMHAVYMQMMMQGCLRPLSRGVNSHSIIQAVGMMMAMRMLSPDFRNEMDSHLQQFKDKVQDRIDAKTRQLGDHAESRAAQVRELTGDDASDQDGAEVARRGTSRDDYLSTKWRRRLEDLERRERGNRDLFTPESAAMTEVALAENAFWAMREPGLNSDQVDEIYTSYRAMRKRLRGQMVEDGLEREEVVQRVRMIIGERMESEPELRLMFNGISHGRIVKAPPHHVRLAGTDRVREVWTGEFDDHLGHRIPDDGMFTLRLPMNADGHQVQLAESMKAAMLDSVNRGDRRALGDSVMGYMLGFAAKRQGLDIRDLPAQFRNRMEQSESMLASMDIDGISDEEQQRVYSNAYIDAIEEVSKEDPDFENELMLSLGPDWQERMRAAVADPPAFIAEQRIRPRPYQQGPGPSAMPRPGNESSRDRVSEDYQPA